MPVPPPRNSSEQPSLQTERARDLKENSPSWKCSRVFNPPPQLLLSTRQHRSIYKQKRRCRGGLHSTVDLQPIQPRASESLGAGRVRGVGHRLLRVVAVQINLQQDSDVHENLQESADGELERGLVQDEVNSLERVPAGPHQHHLDTKRQKRREKHLLRRLACE